VLLLTRAGADSRVVGDAVAMLGNVTLLERPMRVSALLSALRSALRARLHQYEIQAHLLELERARDAEANEARRKDEFLAMLAHELRNPLAPIRNVAYVLAKGQADPLTVRRSGQMIERQANHLSRLVDDLLDVARITRGRVVLECESVSLDSLAASAHRLGIPLLGHVADGDSLAHALAVRYASIEHLTGYPGGGVAHGTLSADTVRLPALIAATARAGVWNCPTQAVYELWDAADPNPWPDDRFGGRRADRRTATRTACRRPSATRDE
jgi:signal transduction histidine kinase